MDNFEYIFSITALMVAKFRVRKPHVPVYFKYSGHQPEIVVEINQYHHKHNFLLAFNTTDPSGALRCLTLFNNYFKVHTGAEMDEWSDTEADLMALSIPQTKMQ